MQRPRHILRCAASPFLAASLLIFALTHVTRAQEDPSAPGISDPRAPLPAAPAEPFLDRKVVSVLENFSAWKARMKKEHFTEYLSAYAGIAAGLTGLVLGLLAYRFSDPMSTYRVIRRRTLQLLSAIGGSLGISVAVMQVPPQAIGKVSLLLLTTAIGTVCALVGAWIAFLVSRFASNHAARRAGKRVTDRMRHA